MKKVPAILAAAFVSALLGSCTLENGSAQVKNVFIRSRGETVTTYRLSTDGKIIQSTTLDSAGVPVVRQYSYDSGGRLTAVGRERLSVRALTTMAHGTDGGPPGPVSRKTVLEGRADEVQIQYFFTNDGRLDGMLQRDANGNILSKAADK